MRLRLGIQQPQKKPGKPERPGMCKAVNDGNEWIMMQLLRLLTNPAHISIVY